MHQFEQAGVVDRNPDDPKRPTNSPKTVYTVSDEALEAIKKYGTPSWDGAVKTFILKKGCLVDRYDKRRKASELVLKIPNGTEIGFSPGKHNELQIKVITEFRVLFCGDAEVLYVGDTARKLLYVKAEVLKALNIPLTEHGKLPDVLLYNRVKDQLILVEAVTAHGPLSPKRQVEIEKTLKDCKSQRIYVSAFPDFREFRKHIDNIAWETEVWIANNPEHMIHFNGPKFITVHSVH